MKFIKEIKCWCSGYLPNDYDCLDDTASIVVTRTYNNGEVETQQIHVSLSQLKQAMENHCEPVIRKSNATFAA